MEFEGKVVYITGAAKGQGKAMALSFAKEGAKIIAFDLGKKIGYPSYNDASMQALEDLKKEIEQLGSECIIYGGDVRKAEDCENAVKAGIDAFGKIDILINNAGICAYAFADEMTEDEWDSMMDINAKGTLFFTQLIARHMVGLPLAGRAVPLLDNLPGGAKTQSGALTLAPLEALVAWLQPCE